MKTETIYGVAGVIAMITATYLLLSGKEYGVHALLGTMCLIGRDVLVRIESIKSGNKTNRRRHRD